jgi:1-acyl-sn-glycerol-3-phosphate acyltransferase
LSRVARTLAERPVRIRARWGLGLATRGLLRLAGWRVEFDGLPAAQGVLVVAPHTSNWDFVVGVLAKWAVGLQVSFWGKASLFRVPLFGHWLRWLGGIAVDRGSPQGHVSAMVKRFSDARAEDSFLWLALAPEGTRSRTEGWRSGFYRVALAAGVPVGLVVLDFGRRRVVVDHFWQLCGEPAADLAAIAARLEGCQGCRPERAAPVRLLEG